MGRNFFQGARPLYNANGDLNFAVTAPGMGPRQMRLQPPALFDPETDQLTQPASPTVLPPVLDARPDPEQEIVATNRNLGPIKPPARPTFQAPPLRDLGGESRRGTQAGLMALAFGIGQGRGQAPALGAAALRGVSQGADAGFQNATRQVDAQNRLAASEFEQAQDVFRMQQMDANRRGDELARSDTLELQKAKARADYLTGLDGLDDTSLQDRLNRDESAGLLQGLGIQIPRVGGRWDVSAVVTERQAIQKDLDDSRRTDDRRQLITSLSQLTPEGRRAAVSALGQSGDLAALGFNVTQDTETGAYQLDGVNLDELGKALSASMSPEAEAIERKRAQTRSMQSTQDLFELLMRDPRTSPGARTELLKRQGILKDAIANGRDVPGWVYEISPEAIRDMTPQQREAFRVRQEAIAASKDRTKAMQGQWQKSYDQRERFHKDYVAGKKDSTGDQKTWERNGIPSINAIDDDVARMIKDIAQLRNGPMQKSATGAFITDENGNPVYLKPSANDLQAANDMIAKVKEYQAQQEDIARSYGYRRDPATRRWVKQAGGAK